MQKYSAEQYNNIFKKLPYPIKDLVASTSTSKRIFDLASKHKMQIDQAGILNDLVLDVLMGIVSSKDLRKELVKETNISEMEASLIIRDVDEEILKPVKELMFTIYADGAPYKPTSMQILDENEDDQQILKKEDILKEIENPTPAEVKKVISGITKKTVEKKEEKKLVGNISSSHEIEKYSEELEQGEKKIEVKTQNISLDVEESKKRILENIGAIKLGGVVTMPKINQEIKEGETTIKESPPSLKEESEKKPIQSEKTEAKEIRPIQTKPNTDPYREPIE